MEEQQTGLKRGLKLIYVYAIAAGAIFTFIGYWDTIFMSYCGPATFLAFAAMTCAVLPIALVYCELAPMFPQVGAELCYNTVGLNKHIGFFSSWAIMMAWIAVPPAAVMAIIQWFTAKVFPQFGWNTNPSFMTITIIGIILICLYCVISLNDIQIAGKAQLVMLIGAIFGCIVTAVILIFFSGQWSFSNFTEGGFFRSTTIAGDGFGGWCLGLAMIITPYFGFETVPQMVEEGDFPIENSTKAIWGSVVTCGIVYTLFFFALGGLEKWESLLFIDGVAANGEYDFLAISAMQRLGGGIGTWNAWNIWALVFGIFAILCAIGTCLLGFWLSTVRLIYAMGRQNYLPQSFAKVNKHNQPILPNIFLLVISIAFLILQNGTTFMKDFFNLMSFGCGLAYMCTSISALRIHAKHPEWATYKLPGGQFMRILALVIATAIAIGTCIGQGVGSWISFGVYMGIGVLLWLTMLQKWKTDPPKWKTPDGEKTF
ncbi:MAG: APC family permease [Coprococcus sp.]|nr:APC family permease [Coprococcus sp.]